MLEAWNPEPGIEPGSGFPGAQPETGVCSVRPSVPWRPECLKDERYPQFFRRTAARHDKKIGSPTRRLRRSRAALLDPSGPP